MIKHYTAFFAPNPFKVRLAFAELGVAAEHVEMNVPARENRQPPFLALNPNGKLPVIEDDGFVLWESNAILGYLGRKFRERRLWPTGEREEADAARWLFYELSTFQPPAADIWWQRWLTPRFGGSGPKEGAVEEAQQDLKRPLKVVDAHLADREWILGEFSLVDCAFAAPLMCLDLGEAPVDPIAFPHLAAYWKRWKARPSFAATPFRFPERAKAT